MRKSWAASVGSKVETMHIWYRLCAKGFIGHDRYVKLKELLVLDGDSWNEMI